MADARKAGSANQIGVMEFKGELLRQLVAKAACPVNLLEAKTTSRAMIPPA